MLLLVCLDCHNVFMIIFIIHIFFHAWIRAFFFSFFWAWSVLEKQHSSPVPSRSPFLAMKPKASTVPPAVAPSPGETLAFRIPKDYPHSRFSKAPLAVYPPKGARNKTWCVHNMITLLLSLIKSHILFINCKKKLSATLFPLFSSVSLPVVSLEKMPCLSRGDSATHVRLTSSSSSPSSHKPSSLTTQASQRSSEKLTNGRGSSGPSTPRSITPPSSLDKRPSPARSPLDRRAASTPSPSPLDRKSSLSPSPSHRAVALPALPSVSPLEKKQQNGTKTPSRSHKRLSG